MRLTAFLLPPFWAYAAGYSFLPLATALGTPHPDIVASALQAVGFVAWTTSILAIEGLRARGETQTDLSRRDWQQIRETAREQERQAARVYEQNMKRQFKLVIQNRHYTFPAGITPAHLLHLARVVGEGYKPTDRALYPTFERGTGKSYQAIKDYMIHNPNHAPGELAVELSGRGDWSLTRAGMGVLLQWVSYPYTPLLAPGKDAKKVCLLLSKGIRSNRAIEN